MPINIEWLVIISLTHRILENHHVSTFVSEHCSLHQFVPSKPWVFVFCRQTNDLWIIWLSPILEPIPHRPQSHDCIGVSVYHHCITYDWRIISAMYSPQDRKMTNRWWRHERKTCNLFNIYPGWWLCNHPLSTCVDSTQDLHMCVSCLKDDQPLNQQTHQLALSIVQLVSRLCNLCFLHWPPACQQVNNELPGRIAPYLYYLCHHTCVLHWKCWIRGFSMLHFWKKWCWTFLTSF